VFTARYGLYLCVLCGSQNKQRLFHCTTLTDWFVLLRRSVFTARYDLNLTAETFISSLFHGRAMAQVVSRRPLTAEARVRSQVITCEICGGQNGYNRVFSQYFSFPCHNHYTNAPYSSSSICSSYQKPLNLTRSNVLLEIREHWI
jgi:hypothetical protein